jgi:teichuronic acid exporter
LLSLFGKSPFNVKLSELRTPVISALRWTALSRLLMQVATWSATVVAIRLLSPTDYGIVTVATLLSSYLVLLGEAGFGSAIVQRQVRDPSLLALVFSFLLISGSILAVVVYFTAPLVAWFFEEPRAVGVMRLAALQFVLLPLGTVPDAQLRMDMRFKEFGIANFVGAITSAVSVVCLALVDAGPYSLIGALLISQAARVSVMQWFARSPIGLSLDFSRLRGLARYSALIVVERSVWFWYTEFDNIVVARLLGTGLVGTFSVAKSVIQAPLDRISEVVNSVTFPAFSRMQHQGGQLSEAFLKSVRIGSYLVFPLFWGLGAVSEPLVELAFGEKWRAAILPMQLLTFAMPLRTLQAISTPVIHAIGRPDVSLVYTTTSAVVMLPLMIVGVLKFGIAGAAGSWAVGFPVLYALSVRLFSKPLGLRSRDIWLVLVRPAFGALVMVLLVAFVCEGLLADTPSIIRLVSGILVGAAAYILVVVMIDRSAYRELSGLARSFARR